MPAAEEITLSPPELELDLVDEVDARVEPLERLLPPLGDDFLVLVWAIRTVLSHPRWFLPRLYLPAFAATNLIALPAA